MNKLMKMTIFLLGAALLLAESLYAAPSVKKEVRMSFKKIQSILGKEKLISGDLISVSRREGYIFSIARDNKTKKLEWFLLDPFKEKIKGSGACPFGVFMHVAISPDSRNALIMTRQPLALWHLDLSTKECKKVFENPKKGGLALTSISPISFTDDGNAFSIFDMWDGEHFVIDTYVVSFVLPDFKVEKIASFKTLVEKATKAISSGASKNKSFKINFIRLAAQKNLVYVLESREKESAAFTDYIFRFTPPDSLSLIDSAQGKILPLDFASDSNLALYQSVLKDTNSLAYREGDKKTVILDGKKKALAGKIVNKNLLGVAVIEEKQFSVLLGSPSEKLTSVLTFTAPQGIGFCDDGKKMYLTNNFDITYYTITP